jgi:hypothetical protein
MEQICQPTKEQVREWLRERLATREPPPEIKQIQFRVGWVGPPRKSEAKPSQ